MDACGTINHPAHATDGDWSDLAGSEKSGDCVEEWSGLSDVEGAVTRARR
jgi:hypothetical protein